LELSGFSVGGFREVIFERILSAFCTQNGWTINESLYFTMKSLSGNSKAC